MLQRRGVERCQQPPSRIYTPSPSRQSGRDLSKGMIQSTPEAYASNGMLPPKASSQSEVTESVTNITVEQPDLSPILQAIHRLPNPEDCLKDVLDAIANLVVQKPDVSPLQQMMQDMKADIKRTLDVFHKEILEDLRVLQHEVLRNRQETRSSAEMLLGDIQVVPRELEELRKEIQRLASSDIDLSEVLNAIQQIVIPAYSPALIADAVHDRLIRSRLRVDNSEVLQSLQKLEIDQAGFANLVSAKIGERRLRLDASESAKPDYSPAFIADAVNDRLLRSRLRVDNSEVLQSLQNLVIDQAGFANLVSAKIGELRLSVNSNEIQNAIPECNPAFIADAVHDRLLRSRFVLDNSDVLEMLQNLEIDQVGFANLVSARIGERRLSVDTSEISQAIGRLLDTDAMLDILQKMNIPDSAAIDRVVAECLRKHDAATRGAGAEARHALRTIPDNCEVLQAIRNVERAFDLQSFADSVRGSFPDQVSIAGAVVEQLRYANLRVDNSEVLTALNSIRLAIENAKQFDVNAAPEEVSKADAVSNQTDVLRALANIQFEIRQLREGDAISRTTQHISQSVSNLPGAVQRLTSTPSAAQPQTQIGLSVMEETVNHVTQDAAMQGIRNATLPQTTQLLPHGYGFAVGNAGTGAVTDSVFNPRSQPMSYRVG